MLRFKCKTMQLYYNDKRIKLTGQPSLTMIANLIEAANNAEHQNRYLVMEVAHNSFKKGKESYELNWWDIESYRLGDKIEEGL